MRKIFLFLLIATTALAEGTHTWEQTKFDDFEKGTAKGVAIRSDGMLELAPAFKPIFTTPSTYIWSIAAEKDGTLYAAAGAPARVYRVLPDGQASIIFEAQELQVQALIVDPAGVIYAATSPDGKVYKIERGKAAKKVEEPASSAASERVTGEKAEAKSEEAKPKVSVDRSFAPSTFFDPKTKYIWDLALDKEGRLYVATGDKGEIFRVEKTGQSTLFFKSDEAHIRVLAFDPSGNLIAGSDGSGLVYRISKSGEAFVLYSAPKKEITALAVDAQGNIYAAGAGEKRPGPSVAGPSLPTPGAMMPLPQMSSAPPIPAASAIPVTAPIPFPALGASGGSEVYQIAPDGSPKRLWTSREDLVYTLGFDQRGALVAGTGNKGRIFAIRNDAQFTDLLKASATQVTAFAIAPAGGLYVATSNLGKLFLLGAEPTAEGTYESDIFDAKIFSRWGRAAVRGRGAFELFARSGNVDNPDRNWSPWKQVNLQTDTPLDVPAARFVQWRTVMRPGAVAPAIDSVLLNYLPKNVSPVIDDVAVQLGARFQPQPRPTSESVMVGGTAPPVPRFEAPVPATRDRDSIALRWTAHDDNDDQLVYSIYYRGDGETRWKLLKDRITDKFYSFDSGLLPDGGYTVRVVASDAASHSPEEALSSEKESSRFEVDSTPPRVQDLHAGVEGAQLHITFTASDGFSAIKRAEYSVDAGEWHFVEPVGELSDAKTENYDFSVPSPGAETAAGPGASRRIRGDSGGDGGSTEHIVVVRVYDRFDNMGTAKSVIHAK